MKSLFSQRSGWILGESGRVVRYREWSVLGREIAILQVCSFYGEFRVFLKREKIGRHTLLSGGVGARWQHEDDDFPALPYTFRVGKLRVKAWL